MKRITVRQLAGNLAISCLLGYNFSVIYSTLISRDTPLTASIVLSTAVLGCLALLGLGTKWRDLNIQFVPVAWLLFFIISIVFSLFIQGNYFNDVIDVYGRSAYAYVLSLFVIGLLWMLLGILAHFGEVRRSNLWAILMAVGCAGIVGFGTNWSFFVNYQQLRADHVTGSIHHLVLGQATILLLWMSYALAKGYVAYVIAALGLFLLLVFGGRGSFYAFGLALIVGEILLRRSVINLRVLGYVIVSAMVVALASEELVRRMAIFDVGILESDSAVGRLEGLRVFVEGFWKFFLVGNPYFIIEQFGSIGFYVHNILSLVQFYGVFPLLFLLVILYFCVRAIQKRVSRETAAMDRFGFFLFLTAVFEVGLFKSVSYYPLWFAIGFWVARASISYRLGSSDALYKRIAGYSST